MQGLRDLVSAALLLGLCACSVEPSDLGEDMPTATSSDPTTGSDPSSTTGSTADPTGATETGVMPTSDSTASETGIQVECDPFHACSPQHCDSSCGSRWHSLELDGCPRLGCDTDDACPDGLVCDRKAEWGGCGDTPCVEEDGACICNIGLSCPGVEGPGICREADLYPPPGMGGIAFCAQFEDAESCNAVEPFPIPFPGSDDLVGCQWLGGVEMPEEGTCGDATPFEGCIYVRPWAPEAFPTCSTDESVRVMSTKGPDGQLRIVRPEGDRGPFMLAHYCHGEVSEEPCSCGCPPAE